MEAVDPNDQKKLGRSVRGYSDAVWEKRDRDVVKRASTAKVTV